MQVRRVLRNPQRSTRNPSVFHPLVSSASNVGLKIPPVRLAESRERDFATSPRHSTPSNTVIVHAFYAAIRFEETVALQKQQGPVPTAGCNQTCSGTASIRFSTTWRQRPPATSPDRHRTTQGSATLWARGA